MLASRLRRELAEQAKHPKQIPQAAPVAASSPPVASPLPDAALALAAALQALHLPQATQAMPPPRDTLSGPRWGKVSVVGAKITPANSSSHGPKLSMSVRPGSDSKSQIAPIANDAIRLAATNARMKTSGPRWA
jgi:hypothetical protein